MVGVITAGGAALKGCSVRLRTAGVAGSYCPAKYWKSEGRYTFGVQCYRGSYLQESSHCEDNHIPVRGDEAHNTGVDSHLHFNWELSALWVALLVTDGSMWKRNCSWMKIKSPKCNFKLIILQVQFPQLRASGNPFFGLPHVYHWKPSKTKAQKAKKGTYKKKKSI